jgi:iron complex outermembrane receptor protein
MVEAVAGNAQPHRRTPGVRDAARSLAVLISALVALGPNGIHADETRMADLADLSLEDLANLEVTSVSRRPEPVSDAAASIFVITNGDIRRSGARTLPEALRLAPNLQVARVSAGTYAISARGFNNSLGNKLLVLIDGRTVYTPLFSGVFWDMQDVVLEEVERIEVISGPGATLWGTNAVNGVINVITRAAKDTQGVLLAGGGGDRHGPARGGARRRRPLPGLRQGVRAREHVPRERNAGPGRAAARPGRLSCRLGPGRQPVHAPGRRLQR